MTKSNFTSAKCRAASVAVIAVVIVLVAFVSSCIQSLHPIYTDETLTFEKALLGAWTSTAGDKPNTWEFAEAGENSYSLVITESDGKTGKFIAHLAKVGEVMFLDLYPEKLETDSAGFYGWHFLSVHTFAVVERIDEDEFAIRNIIIDWVKEYLKANPTAIAHEWVGDFPVFTASPEELQEFHMNHLATEGAFSGPLEFVRKQG
ncbi:MAG: hypothetical protein A2Y63_07015 [Candidatus Riflebacteria bacterium RBG_13_59_9]|nr:MAG: hypothetical protein A2Y63_07015 [Candidatus Riflebacteria bacterium RBG_13_59_9]